MKFYGNRIAVAACRRGIHFADSNALDEPGATSDLPGWTNRVHAAKYGAYDLLPIRDRVVAVIGDYAKRFSAEDCQEFWYLLLAGKFDPSVLTDGILEVSPHDCELAA